MKAAYHSYEGQSIRDLLVRPARSKYVRWLNTSPRPSLGEVFVPQAISPILKKEACDVLFLLQSIQASEIATTKIC